MDSQNGASLGVVQAHQKLALRHNAAVPHQQFCDDSALAVLHGLAVAVNRQGARPDDSPI